MTPSLDTPMAVTDSVLKTLFRIADISPSNVYLRPAHISCPGSGRSLLQLWSVRKRDAFIL